jgi:large subunit ribosomal protein L25
MARPQLSAEPRAVLGKKVSLLRREGRLPAVVYGAGRESQAVSLDMREFELLHRHTGRHAVLDLKISGAGGRAQPVLLQAIQEHPITRHPIHVDLLVVNLEEERTVDVPVVAVGESAAIDKMGGVLLHLRDSVMVRAKPDDLPSSLELDITPLDSFDAVLHVSDLSAPAGVTIVTDGTEPLARVQPPRVEEEPVVAEAEVEGEEGVEAPAAEAEEAGAGESSAPAEENAE